MWFNISDGSSPRRRTVSDSLNERPAIVVPYFRDNEFRDASLNCILSAISCKEDSKASEGASRDQSDEPMAEGNFRSLSDSSLRLDLDELGRISDGSMRVSQSSSMRSIASIQ